MQACEHHVALLPGDSVKLNWGLRIGVCEACINILNISMRGFAVCEQVIEEGLVLWAGMLDLSQVGKPKQGRPGPRRKATEAAESDTAAILMQMAAVAEGLGRAPLNKRRYSNCH